MLLLPILSALELAISTLRPVEWGFENLCPWAIFLRPCLEKHTWALQFSICCKLSKLTIKRKKEENNASSLGRKIIPT